ncbi:MAG: dienelactone hydrolase family protein [Anaerolineales bacterium]|nr:dienelactone hydrolase family protein [Anaerolineales bacterium]
MRTFEIALIVANLLSLLLGFKKQTRVVWWGTAGINLSIFLIHGIFEGFRYQMVFSYIFVILLAIFAFVTTNDKSFEAQTPKVLMVITISLSFVFLMFTSLLAYALPVFTLPKPTGRYDVGIQYFQLVDEKRDDPFLDQSTKKRELMVKIYYPAKDDGSKPFSPYFHSPRLVKLFAEFYGMPDFLFDHLNLVKTNSKEGLPLSDKEQSYPVILFSHGAGTTMEIQTSQSEDLASHGYVVVAVDHTYVSAATVFPDRIVSHKEAITDFNTAEPAEIITQIMADDASFVIDKLSEMDAGKIDSIFTGRLDIDQIGAIGHSVGGAVAYNLAIHDSRVKAAIDLDGVVYITLKWDPKDVAPFLILASDKYAQAIQSRIPLMEKYEDLDDTERKIMSGMYGSQQAYNDAYDKAWQTIRELTEVLETSGNLYTIQGSNHMKFTDIGLFIGSSWLREPMNIGGRTEPTRVLEITEAVTRVFFDQYLKGETEVSLESLVEKYPELKQVDLP